MKPALAMLERLERCFELDKVRKRFNGNVPEGDRFAKDLANLLANPLCRVPNHVREAARALCEESSRSAIPYAKRRGGQYSRVDGLRTDFPEFCHVFEPDWEAGRTAWIRLALVETAIRKDVPVDQQEGFRTAPLSAADRNVLGLVAYLPPERWGKKFGTLLGKLAENLEKGNAKGWPIIPPAALALVTISNLKPGEAAEQVRAALRNGYAFIAELQGKPNAPLKTGADDKDPPGSGAGKALAGRLPRRPLFVAPASYFPLSAKLQALVDTDPDGPPLDDLAELPPLVETPDAESTLAEEGEDPEESSDESPSVGESAKACRDEAEAAHLLFLSGSLQPEVYRVLSPPIFAAVVAYAESHAFGRPDRIVSERLAWLVIMISGLTARPAGDVVDALIRFARGGGKPTTADFAVDFRGFWSRLPPRTDPARTTLPTRLRAIHFPWPTTFAEQFAAMWASRSDWESVLSADVIPHVHESSKALRAGVYEQFSLVRLRNTLPSAIYTGCGDDCLSQIVAGDTLRHSDAPLHYYSNVEGRMSRQLAWSLSPWLPPNWKWIVRIQPRDGLVFGLPRSCLPGSYVESAIAKLADRADALPPPRATSEALCSHHNKLTAYVVALFAAGTSHRLTDHLEDVTRRHMVLRWNSQAYGVANFMDKLTVCALSSRAVALSPLVVCQIEIYLAHFSRLAARLSRKKGRHRKALRSIEAAIRGDGPLFIYLEHEDRVRGSTEVRAFNSSDLSRMWPEWTYPGYVLRHRFASFTWRFGLARDDVTRQMGHAVEGVAFDAADPDSVIRFVERLAKPRQDGTEAPLDRALRIEGWRRVRSWVPERFEVPSTPLDASSMVVAQHAGVMSTHEKLQARIAEQAMGKTIIVGDALSKVRSDLGSTLFKAARDFAYAQLGHWLALPEQRHVRESKTIARDDVERLMEAMKAAMPDRRYLVPATNVLRNRLQRLRNDGADKWEIHLPAPICVLRVAPPVITPACARAYNHCIAILEICDEWLMEQDDQQDLHSGSWLGVLVTQLVVRSGISRSELLVEVLENAHLARRHPLLTDTVLVPIGRAGPRTAAREEAVESNPAGGPPLKSADHEGESVGEYVAVQGLAAICYLRWSAAIASEGAFKGGLQLIRNAFRDFVQSSRARQPARYGDAGPSDPMASSKGEALDDFLICAQLARRLTMPGVRSAWEDGRLSARTLDLDRQIDTWRGTVRREAASPAAIPPVTKKSSQSEVETVTGEILTKVRQVLTLSERERGHPRSGKVLVAEIEQLEREHSEMPSAARWAIRYVKTRLRRVENRGHRATLYEDYVVWRGPFLSALGDRDLADLDPDAMTDVLVRALRDGCSDPPRALRVIRGIVRQLVEDGFESPDMAMLFEAAKVTRPEAAAYLVSSSEAAWISGQLRHWTTWARHSGAMAGADAFEMEAARVLWELQYGTGMRTAEAVHLRHADVANIGGEWVICVRRLRRRGAKTQASVRVVRLKHFCSPDALERFESFLTLQRQAQSRRYDRSYGVFARPDAESRIATSRRITRPLNFAMRLILPSQSGRPYAGRHSRASFGVHALLPPEHQSPGWFRPGAPLMPSYLRHLPLRFQLRFLSRGVGHAYSLSTLTYYTHSLADLRMLDRGWTRPTRELMAAASGVKTSTLGVRLARSKISARDTESVVGFILDQVSAAVPDEASESAVPFEATPPIAQFRPDSIERMVGWVRQWLAGERLSVLEHRSGIAAGWLGQYVREIERFDQLYRADIVDRRMRLDGIESQWLKPAVRQRYRGPRLPYVEEVAKVLDEVERQTPEVWLRLIRHVQTQRPGFAGLTQTNDAGVRAVISRIIAMSRGVNRAISDTHELADTGDANPSKAPSRTLIYVLLLIMARHQVRLEMAGLALQ